MVESRVMATACFLAVDQVENAFAVSCSSCLPSGVRVSSARTLNRYEPSPPTVVTALVLPIGVAKIASVRAWLSWPFATQPRSPPVLALVPSELSRASAAKSAPLSDWSLRALRWSMSLGRYMIWITCQPNADWTGGRMSPGLRPGLVMAARNAASTVVIVLSKYGSLPPVPVGPRADSSSLSLRAIESNRLGSVLSFAYAVVASDRAFAQAGSSLATFEAFDGSPFGE